MTLKHIWSFLCYLTAASAVTVHYPSINGTETLSCNCPNHQCQRVYWYRLLQNGDTPEFLVSTNNLNKPVYAKTINQNRFKTTASESSNVLYTLRITGIQKKDAGFYSCLLSSQNSAQDAKDLMPDGHSIRPGEAIVSLAPTTKKPKRVNRRPSVCRSNNQSAKGCKPLVFWSGIGAVLLLLVILISTLYYFSRLPKKCRHHFVKQQQLR